MQGSRGDSSLVFENIKITSDEYIYIKTFLYAETGIDLGDFKQQMVLGRLYRRLRHYNVRSYTEYFEVATKCGHMNERQIMVDLLSTNETYFFREIGHFDFLREEILPDHPKGVNFRVWSAASSTGEEAYSIAMELGGSLGQSPWEIMGSDVSTQVISKAKRALYRFDRTKGIPDKFLKKYCSKGTGEFDDHLLVNPILTERVTFRQINLMKPIPMMQPFDLVFLRNVLIYFDMETKIKVVNNVLSGLKKGGCLFVGHSESLNSLKLKVELTYVAPTIYRKV